MPRSIGRPSPARVVLGLAIAAFLACRGPRVAHATGLEKINHIIVIYLENRSFDNIFGTFPEADGLKNSDATATQVDENGAPYKTLPPIINSNLRPPAVDTRFPVDLPNKPFRIDQYVPADAATGDLMHRFYQERMQIDGGKMDRFALLSGAGGLSQGYYDGSGLALWKYAQQYTLADHFFHAAFGGSFLNHMLLVCACMPRYENAPDDLKAQLDSGGKLIKDGALTPQGYAVNTIQPRAKPYAASSPEERQRLPPLTMPTIGDRLTDDKQKIDWAWYAGGWDDAVGGTPHPSFQFHHQPFVYFKRYAEGTEDRQKHLKDGKQFVIDIEKGTLPAVSFYKPIGVENEHPGYADIATGDRHFADVMQKIEKSPIWRDAVVIVTFDEHGGFWDHVPPPAGDEWGPGTRVPAVIISPFAKRKFVDHTVYDTTSILKLIETRYGLEPLGDRDRKANDLTNALSLE